MRTVDKALNLLKYFSIENPEWGLSDLARTAGMDKATTLRMLQVLSRHGFLAQNSRTRRFALGVAPLNLAKVREATNPLSSVVDPVLHKIMEHTQETAHASLGSGREIVPVGISEPQRNTRVFVDPARSLPLHAAASGFAYLAFCEPGILASVLKASRFECFTGMTPETTEDLKPLIERTRRDGYGVADNTYDPEVVGVAAPFFDQSGFAIGTIAVASLSYRMTTESLLETADVVIDGALEITRGLGAEPNEAYLSAIGDRQHLGEAA